MVAMYQAQKSTRSRSDNGGPGGEVPGRRRVQLFIYLFIQFFIIVDLQCSVNFCYIAMCSSYTYIHIHIYSFPHIIFMFDHK